jgi:hypothetical protein
VIKAMGIYRRRQSMEIVSEKQIIESIEEANDGSLEME